MAKLEEKLFSVMERNAELEEENARLRREVADLKQQLAAARKDSSTSSKPPSSDIVKPKKPLPKQGQEAEEGRAAGTRATRAVAISARGGRSFRAPHARLLPGLRRQAGRFAV